MRNQDGSIGDLLSYDVPDSDGARLVLFAIRRMGVAGLQDAHATHALIGTFGLSYRRPLVLVRALVAELSRVSIRSILIAPLCCVRMTAGESALIGAIGLAAVAPHAAHDMLSGLCGVPTCLGLLSSAQAVEQAFADLGRPIVPN
ncbi:hypothetical protein SAMN05444678_10215 [Sphingomonas sp. YR710]|uniref:DUF6628 family protein n=1 Tax=Sphingomonas sp. YR710 TaxID=1882773 RepID=UPI00088510F1|nr:DUF6628 family protein [Sphingomonas sp. YR710]SDC22504.1 hypothetical protein SAMN05444678_10215 [Sphingomonas sp. YR710]